MKIPISELKNFCNLMFDHLEKQGHTSLELDADYYWTISEKEIFDPYNEPKKIYLGQLYDDYESIKNVSNGKNEPITYGLVWLSSIFRYVGEKIVK